MENLRKQLSEIVHGVAVGVVGNLLSQMLKHPRTGDGAIEARDVAFWEKFAETPFEHLDEPLRPSEADVDRIVEVLRTNNSFAEALEYMCLKNGFPIWLEEFLQRGELTEKEKGVLLELRIHEAERKRAAGFQDRAWYRRVNQFDNTPVHALTGNKDDESAHVLCTNMRVMKTDWRKLTRIGTHSSTLCPDCLAILNDELRSR